MMFNYAGKVLHMNSQRNMRKIQEKKPPLINHQSAVYLYSNVACAMQATSATHADTYINVLLNIRAQLSEII